LGIIYNRKGRTKPSALGFRIGIAS
jgi:hypothetical protein